MIRARTHLRQVAVIGAVAVFAAGCGGGGETADPAADAGAGAVTPGATTPGAVAGNTGTPGATDPATGQPLDPTSTGAVGGDAASTATIPDLVGGDVGGLVSASSSSVFSAQAVENDKLTTTSDEDAADSATSATGAGASATTPTKAAPAFSGAKIYVDGIVHDVTRGGTFPKGNPVFKLVSVTGTEIEVELIAGEFTTGGGTGTVLDKGDLVSLVNASEQLTYRIKYLRGITSTSAVTF